MHSASGKVFLLISDNGREDLLDLVDGHNAIMSDEDVHKCHVVWMALEGYDPYEEEE